MASPFRLFDLPSVAFRHALRSMDLVELFELSLSSETARVCIQDVDIRPASLGIYRDNSTAITVMRTINRTELRFDFDPHPKLPSRRIDVGSHSIEVIEKRGNSFKCRKRQIETDFLKLAVYLAELFHCERLHAYIDMQLVYDVRKALSLPHFRNCGLLCVKGVPDYPDELDTLLDEVKNITQLAVACTFKNGLPGKKIMKYPNLYVHHVESPLIPRRYETFGWMRREDLLQLDCETSVIAAHNFTEQDLNEFVLQWLRGEGCPRLRMLQVWFRLGAQLDAVLEHTDWLEYDGKRRPRFYRLKIPFHVEDVILKDLYDAKDVVRKSDGRLASLTFDKNNSCVTMFTWP